MRKNISEHWSAGNNSSYAFFCSDRGFVKHSKRESTKKKRTSSCGTDTDHVSSQVFDNSLKQVIKVSLSSARNRMLVYM